MKKYGLIGKKLDYSFSKIIHEFLINEFNLDATYDLVEIDYLDCNLLTAYDGLNITTPYKMQVCECVTTSEIACNIVKDGFGYNVDVDGFKYLLSKFNFEINKIVVLGTGGSAMMIKNLNDYNTEVIETYNIPITRYSNITGDILVNATPVGMNEYESLVNEEIINNFKGVIDLNYNPINSKLKGQCINVGIPFTNGLDMLIIQAIRSFEIFNNVSVNSSVFNKVLFHVYKELKLNIAIIGMSLAGKTTIVKKHGGSDLDELIISEYGCIDNLIVDELNFRIIENKVLSENLDVPLISLGGGIVTYEENFEILQNHLIIFLNTPIELLHQRLLKSNRPLLKNSMDLDDLFSMRISKYLSFSNLIMNDSELEVFLNEYFSN